MTDNILPQTEDDDHWLSDYFEPWTISPDGNIEDSDEDIDGYGEVILDCDGLYPASMIQGHLVKRTSERIIACVNFCSGIHNNDLLPDGLRDLIDRNAKLEQTNARLLGANRKLVAQMKQSYETDTV